MGVNQVLEPLMMAKELDALFTAKKSIDRAITRLGILLRNEHCTLSDHDAQHLSFCIKNDIHAEKEIRDIIKGKGPYINELIKVPRQTPAKNKRSTKAR